MLQDNPPIICAVITKTHYTLRGVKENNTFSINIPFSHLEEVVDYCGLYSGFQVDKSCLFEVFYGELKTVPMVMECELNIECGLVDSRDLNTMELILGEINEVYYEVRCLSENKPDYRKMDPMMFFMPEGPYIKTGDVIAKAFEVGKNYRKDH